MDDYTMTIEGPHGGITVEIPANDLLHGSIDTLSRYLRGVRHCLQEMAGVDTGAYVPTNPTILAALHDMATTGRGGVNYYRSDVSDLPAAAISQ